MMRPTVTLMLSGGLALLVSAGAAPTEPGVPIRGGTFQMGTPAASTVPAGSYPANDCGLHDLAGSVWEFLYDGWEESYPPAASTDPCVSCPVDDGELLAIEGRRAVRGGSFGGSVVNLRTRWRDSHVVTNAASFVGFRCAYPARPRPGDLR